MVQLLQQMKQVTTPFDGRSLCFGEETTARHPKSAKMKLIVVINLLNSLCK